MLLLMFFFSYFLLIVQVAGPLWLLHVGYVVSWGTTWFNQIKSSIYIKRYEYTLYKACTIIIKILHFILVLFTSVTGPE